MLWNWAVLLAGAAGVTSHATHHVEDQDPFSPDRLRELEAKWGTDVSCLKVKEATVVLANASLVGFQRYLYLCSSASHTMLDTPRDQLRYCYPGCTF